MDASKRGGESGRGGHAGRKGGRGGDRRRGGGGRGPKEGSHAGPSTSHSGVSAVSARRPEPVASAAPTAAGSVASSFKTVSAATGPSFRDIPLIDAATIEAMEKGFGFKSATPIQAMAVPPALRGVDLIAQARTGTGKTIAFLIPAVQREARIKAGAGKFGVLVLAPTRELAEQIRREADVLGRYHGVSAELVMGGTNMNAEVRRTERGAGILIATPGRLIDHIDNSRGFADKLRQVHTVIFDECDRLLDMGFLPSIERILDCVPPPGSRVGLLFSATIPGLVKSVARKALTASHEFVSTVDPTEAPTHEIVLQEALATPALGLAPTVWRVLSHHISTVEPTAYKVIVFLPTARMAQFFGTLFREALPALGVSKATVWDLHSRKSQSARMKASDGFKTATKAVMFSSDVSARGMDFPDVTLVVQVGLVEKDQYIHRLGRTARAGKAGHGVLVLLPGETSLMTHTLKGLPIKPVSPSKPSEIVGSLVVETGAAHPASPAGGTSALPVASADVSGPGKGAEALARVLAAVDKPGSEMQKQAQMAYSSWLGYYNSSLRKLGWSAAGMVALANELFASPGGMGLGEVPILQRKTVSMMGLRGTPGIREEVKGARGGPSTRGGRGAASSTAATATMASPRVEKRERPASSGSRGGAQRGRGRGGKILSRV
jgi:ATP-dependent RNA helicase MSS116, mitochondrial